MAALYFSSDIYVQTLQRKKAHNPLNSYVIMPKSTINYSQGAQSSYQQTKDEVLLMAESKPIKARKKVLQLKKCEN